MRRLTFSSLCRRFAKTGMRLQGPQGISCRSLSAIMISMAFCTAFRRHPTARRHWRRWLKPRASAASSILAARTTRNRLATPAAFHSTRLPSSTPRRPAQHPFGKTFRILKGIEADFLGDGSLDYPDRVLRKFDFVVASVHSRFRMTKKAQTSRILKAIANPYTTILGHMTGRQLTRRQGYEVEIDKV